MTARSNRIDDENESLIVALARGATYSEAGALVGKSPRTVRRRMTDPDFAAAVSARRREHVSQVTGLLLEMGQGALEVLRDVVTQDDFEIHPRLRAAELIFGLSRRYRADTELEARVAELERQLAQGDQDREAGSDG